MCCIDRKKSEAKKQTGRKRERVKTFNNSEFMSRKKEKNKTTVNTPSTVTDAVTRWDTTNKLFKWVEGQSFKSIMQKVHFNGSFMLSGGFEEENKLTK